MNMNTEKGADAVMTMTMIMKTVIVKRKDMSADAVITTGNSEKRGKNGTSGSKRDRRF